MLSKEDWNEAIATTKAHIRKIRDGYAEMAATLNEMVDEHGLELEVDDHGHLIAKPADDLDDVVAMLNDRVDAGLIELQVDEEGHLHIQDLM